MIKRSPDLQYTPAFLDLRRAVESATDDVDGWRAMRHQAERLLLRTKDIRILCWWMRTGIRSGALHVFAFALNLLCDWIEEDWDELHPALSGDEASARFAAMSTLVFRKGVLGDLRDALRFSHHEQRDKSVSLRQIEGVLRQAEPHGSLPFTRETVSSWLMLAYRIAPIYGRDVAESAKETAQILTTCQTVVQRLTSSISSYAANTTEALDLQPLFELCGVLAQCISHNDHAVKLSPMSTETHSNGISTSKKTSIVAACQSQGKNRQEIWQLIESACVSLEAMEPCNPATLLLRRGQKVLRLPFLEQIAELHPESLPQLKKVLGAA